MGQQFPELDLDLDSLQDAEPAKPNVLTDMDLDLDLDTLADAEPIQQVQQPPIQQPLPMSAMREEPSVTAPKVGYWEKFRSPLTDIGTRTASNIRQQLGEPTNFVDKVGQGLIDFTGGAFDAMTAPINAIPMLVTGGASALGSKALSLLGRATSAPAVVSGVQNMSESEGLVGKGLGALEAIGGAFGVKGPKANVAKVLAKEAEAPVVTTKSISIEEPIDPVAAVRTEGVDTAAAAGADEFGVLPPQKPASAEAVSATVPKLPRDLAGAKPRFFNGQVGHNPQFASDIDKALYIVAQTTPSKRNNDYIKFIMDNTGMTAEEVTTEAAKVKAAVKAQASGSQGGDLPVGNIYQPKPAGTPKVPTPVAPNASVSIPDYSPSSEMAARKVFQDAGVTLPEGMTNKQIIDGARALQGGTDIAETVAKVAPEIQKPTAKVPKPKVKALGNGTFSPVDFPDIIMDAEGRVIGTHSGNPARLPKEIERHRALEILNLPRALNSSMDLSFPLRQGLGLIHTKGWWKAWPDMVKSFGSDKAFKSVMDEIRSRPNFRPKAAIKDGEILSDKLGVKLKPSFAEEAGLAISDNLTVREHEYMSHYAEKVPGVKASNRAYTAFANKVRADAFDSMVEDFTKAGMDPRQNMELAKELASFINAASGRGNLPGKLERNAELLSTMFFSPRLIASRLQMGGKSARAIFDPKVYDMSAPNVRREYLKSMLALGSAWTTMTGLIAGAAELTGADASVTLDPRSTDFGKAKIGNVRLDPGAGFQQFVVLAARMASGQSVSSTSGKTKNFADAKTPLDSTYGNTAGNFLENKLAPLPKFGLDLLQANKMDPFDTSDRTARLFSPIMLQDLAEIFNAGKLNEEWPALIPEVFGVGSQSYGKGDFDRRVLPNGIGESLSLPRPKKSIFQ